MHHPPRPRLILMTFAVLLILLHGCSTLPRQEAVPAADTTRAVIPGIPNARYWVDTDIDPFIRDAIASAQREREYLVRSGHQGPLPPVSFLAISGGGDDGAFGAGLLVGWSASGTRPEFKGVTGVSTGALIAPFAFLGSDYDDKLRAVYTTADYITINISSPNTKNLRALQSDEALDALLDAVAQARRRLNANHPNKPIFLKIAPDLEAEQIRVIAATLLRHAIDGVIATNTTIKRSQFLQDRIRECASSGCQNSKL